MNEKDVIRILEASDIRRDYYRILSDVPKDFAYNLIQEGNSYHVFWMENGHKSYIGGVSGKFDNFAEAAETFLEAINEDFPIKRD